MLVSIAWSKQLSYPAAIPFFGAAFALYTYLQSRAGSLEFARRSGFYELGLSRLRGDWHSTELTGVEFKRERHLYQFDLQILGERSLFTLLCTTRSRAGAARLASYLLDPADFAETKARQASVRELMEATELREQLMLLGEYQFQECNPDTLEEWAGTPKLNVSLVLRCALFLCSCMSGATGIAWFAGLLSWMHAAPLLAAALLLQAAAGSILFRRVQLRLKTLRALTNEFSVLQAGLEQLQSRTFTSAKLQALVQRVRDDRAPHHLAKLRRLLVAIAQREREALYVPSLLLCAGTQLVLAVEHWRRHHGEQLLQWIGCWAEFEALNAVACYAYEHPGGVFPKLVEDAGVFDASGLRHPLLPGDICVGNDVALHDAGISFYVVSGSNMAGKSTFLKALGVNAVLAHAGAPICATRARLSLFTICASISIADSLLNAKSKFLAEAERLREAVRCSEMGRPVLFLMDEILSGTNSRDRRLACESIVRTLMAKKALGVLSTHDLSLTEVADIAGLRGFNCHMESEQPDDPLRFDYKVKPGISLRSNALAILRIIGIPVSP